MDCEDDRIFNEIASDVEEENIETLIRLLEAVEFINEITDDQDPRFLSRNLTAEGANVINCCASYLILLVGSYLSNHGTTGG